MVDLNHDELLRLAVLERLESNSLTIGLDLRVGVLDSIVHLAGSAPSFVAWETAQNVASSVSGVRGVVNRIQAPGAPPPSRTIQLDLEERSLSSE